ncbi:hypothetical protein CAPTEDRAFT_221039 [Capitella teleta]|uniref:CUB domain-containing protein n=1 Tax=Capitella teleta TaxID=283909 RepID=R7TXU3_CAPTE|nr:hypothetical protein CAPTEDRAFT_221039 [Capitella teleta]|eukprot:ELT95780.1 hypothetical protein CAPTEDRAFT_221039 [Capitella teleta]
MMRSKIFPIGLLVLMLHSFHATNCQSIHLTLPHKVEVTFVSGSQYTNSLGTVAAPGEFKETSTYERDRTTFTYIYENIESEGAVQVEIVGYDPHPDSWITVREGKYGGYMGQFKGRYTREKIAPRFLYSKGCCLRIEFQTGCCGPAEKGYRGIEMEYRFYKAPLRGRRTNCDGESDFTQLCNGECMRDIFECPCSVYGQYKCQNGVCIEAKRRCDTVDDCGDNSDERNCTEFNLSERELTARDALYALSHILITICSFLAITLILLILFCCVEWKAKTLCMRILQKTLLTRRTPLPTSDSSSTRSPKSLSGSEVTIYDLVKSSDDPEPSDEVVIYRVTSSRPRRNALRESSSRRESSLSAAPSETDDVFSEASYYTNNLSTPSSSSYHGSDSTNQASYYIDHEFEPENWRESLLNAESGDDASFNRLNTVNWETD